MHTYLILQNPGHNKVYYDQSQQMALAELSLTCEKCIEDCSDYQISTISGIRYLSFITSVKLSEYSIELLSRLSFAFGLFMQSELEGIPILIPITKTFVPSIDPKISSVLKYPGKTNEIFTRMMINVARLTSDQSWEKSLKLFDPIAGRGTTLYEGMIYGFDVTGMEIKPQPVKDASIFLKKFFEKEKVKHRFDKYKLKGKSNSLLTQKLEYAYAMDKKDFKNPELQKKVALIEGNSALANNFFKANSYHFIVGDLPYGIAHNNASKPQGESRNPYHFLDGSLDSWFEVLKPGGTMVLAWNANVLSKEKMRELIKNHGFHIESDGAYNQFEHMVDSSIKRDIVVARKG